MNDGRYDPDRYKDLTILHMLLPILDELNFLKGDPDSNRVSDLEKVTLLRIMAILQIEPVHPDDMDYEKFLFCLDKCYRKAGLYIFGARWKPNIQIEGDNIDEYIDRQSLGGSVAVVEPNKHRVLKVKRGPDGKPV